jgi:hypothetical protein
MKLNDFETPLEALVVESAAFQINPLLPYHRDTSWRKGLFLIPSSFPSAFRYQHFRSNLNVTRDKR